MKVVFARIGWLPLYEGPSQTEPRPRRGGSYNKTNIGYEIYNFQPLDGNFYGYFQSPGDLVSLSRIDPVASGESLAGVRIVWVATRDDGGQVVVGWYDEATLFAKARSYPKAVRDGFWYKCVTDPAHKVRLPVGERKWEVPRGRFGMGQANVLYPIDGEGRSRLQAPDYAWMTQILQRIDTYQEESSGEEIVASLAGAAAGQGFVGDPGWRRSLEMHAMEAAMRHFREEGYTPHDEHARNPYDLRCTKGDEELFVEVKGTTTNGTAVLVTSGEVRFARRNAPRTALFIFHSIERDSSGRPRGGKIAIVDPWSPSEESLSPVGYSYTRAE